jgi:hypothetical protein
VRGFTYQWKHLQLLLPVVPTNAFTIGNVLPHSDVGAGRVDKYISRLFHSKKKMPKFPVRFIQMKDYQFGNCYKQNDDSQV